MAKNIFLFTLVIITLIFISGCVGGRTEPMSCDATSYSMSAEQSAEFKQIRADWPSPISDEDRPEYYTDLCLGYKHIYDECMSWVDRCGLPDEDQCEGYRNEEYTYTVDVPQPGYNSFEIITHRC